jgi:hypothetical protein
MAGSRNLTRLVRLGWAAILLLTLLVFFAGSAAWYPRMMEVCYETQQVCQQQMRLTEQETQALLDQGWSVQGFAVYNLFVRSFSKLLGVVLGFLIFWRQPVTRMSLVASLFLIIGVETSLAEVLTQVVPGLRFPVHLLSYIGGVCFGIFFFLFPDGSFVPRWSRLAAGFWAVIYFFPSFLPGSFLNINSWPAVMSFPPMIVFLGSLVFSQVHRYRRVSSPTERAQTRWVVTASAVSITILILNLVLLFTRDVSTTGRIIPFWFLVDLGFQQMSFLIPVSIFVAIRRYRLFEIDILIRRTLVYGGLTLLMGTVYLGSVALLQAVSTSVSGQTSPISIVLSTLAIAALVNPLRRSIQGFIDRRFYRARYNAELALEGFARVARAETDPERLAAGLNQVVTETLQPEQILLWLNPKKKAPPG